MAQDAAVVDEHVAPAVAAVQLAGTRPSRIVTVRSATSVARGSCVASRTAAPSSCALRSSSRMPRPVCASSWPVTSSTSRSQGRAAIAHAQRRALLLAAGELVAPRVLAALQPDSLDECEGAPGRLALAAAPARRARSAMRLAIVWSSPSATSSPASTLSDAPWSDTTLPVAPWWTTNSLRASTARSATWRSLVAPPSRGTFTAAGEGGGQPAPRQTNTRDEGVCPQSCL